MRYTNAAILLLLSLCLLSSRICDASEEEETSKTDARADRDMYARDPFSDMSKTAYVPSAYVADFENTIFDHEDVDEYNVDEHGEINSDGYRENNNAGGGRALRGFHRKFKYWCKARLRNEGGAGDVYGYRQLEITEQDLEPEDGDDEVFDHSNIDVHDVVEEQANGEEGQSRELGDYSRPRRRKCRDHSKYRATCCYYNRKRRGYKRYGYRKCYRDYGKAFNKCHKIKFLKRHGFYRGGRHRGDYKGSSYEDSKSYISRDGSYGSYEGSALSGSYDSGDLDVSYDGSRSGIRNRSDDYRRSGSSYNSYESYGSFSGDDRLKDYRHGSANSYDDSSYDSSYSGSSDGSKYNGSKYRSSGSYDSSYDDSKSYGSDSYDGSSFRSGGSYDNLSDSYDGSSSYDSRSYKGKNYDNSVSIDISVDGSVRKRKKCRHNKHGCGKKRKYDTDVGRGHNKFNMNRYIEN